MSCLHIPAALSCGNETAFDGAKPMFEIAQLGCACGEGSGACAENPPAGPFLGQRAPPASCLFLFLLARTESSCSMGWTHTKPELRKGTRWVWLLRGPGPQGPRVSPHSLAGHTRRFNSSGAAGWDTALRNDGIDHCRWHPVPGAARGCHTGWAQGWALNHCVLLDSPTSRASQSSPAPLNQTLLLRVTLASTSHNKFKRNCRLMWANMISSGWRQSRGNIFTKQLVSAVPHTRECAAHCQEYSVGLAGNNELRERSQLFSVLLLTHLHGLGWVTRRFVP